MTRPDQTRPDQTRPETAEISSSRVWDRLRFAWNRAIPSVGSCRLRSDDISSPSLLSPFSVRSLLPCSLLSSSAPFFTVARFLVPWYSLSDRLATVNHPFLPIFNPLRPSSPPPPPATQLPLPLPPRSPVITLSSIPSCEPAPCSGFQFLRVSFVPPLLYNLLLVCICLVPYPNLRRTWFSCARFRGYLRSWLSWVRARLDERVDVFGRLSYPRVSEVRLACLSYGNGLNS